jgi:hypothetical protein
MWRKTMLNEGNQIHNLNCVRENFFWFHFIAVPVPQHYFKRFKMYIFLPVSGWEYPWVYPTCKWAFKKKWGMTKLNLKFCIKYKNASN